MSGATFSTVTNLIRDMAGRQQERDEGISAQIDKLAAIALRIKRERDLLLAVAYDALDYFENRADVYDGEDGKQEPNEAMRLADTLREAITKVGESL